MNTFIFLCFAAFIFFDERVFNRIHLKAKCFFIYLFYQGTFILLVRLRKDCGVQQTMGQNH